MASFGVEMVGDEPGDIEQRLAKLSTSGRRRANNALRKTAEEIKEDLEDSSPVDTGEYQSSWYIFPVDRDEVWVLNSADHAKFVMLPNQRMINATGADLPSSGVLHNVKGRAKRHQTGLRNNMIQELQSMIQQFRID